MDKKDNIKQLENRVIELETQIHELERDIIHDSLTELKTRAFFEEELDIYLTAITHNEHGKRKEWFGFKNISIVFFDIDHFKKINDTYGHDVGDVILKKVAKTIQSNLRTGDTPARWGGEEIIVSLLGANETDAMMKAEEIRKKIEDLIFPEAPDLRVTISAGVTSSEKNINITEIVKRADQALYEAKSSGRNKIINWSGIKK